MKLHHSVVAFAAARLAFALPAQAEDIKLRIASGHPTANTYVNLMQSFFVPEVTKRVAARTKHKVEFIEGYGGSMVKVADTLEGVQSGHHRHRRLLLLLRAFEPAAARLPGHAAVRHHEPGEERDARAHACTTRCRTCRRCSRTSSTSGCSRLIADNGYNLGTTFEWNNGRRPEGPQARRRRPQPQVAGIRRRDAGAVVAARGLYLDADRRLRRLDHVPVGLRQLQAARGRQVLHRDRLRRDHLARPDDQQGALGPAAEGRAADHARGGARVREAAPARSTRRTTRSRSSS